VKKEITRQTEARRLLAASFADETLEVQSNIIGTIALDASVFVTTTAKPEELVTAAEALVGFIRRAKEDYIRAEAARAAKPARNRRRFSVDLWGDDEEEEEEEERTKAVNRQPAWRSFE